MKSTRPPADRLLPAATQPGTGAPQGQPLDQAVEGQPFHERFKRIVRLGSGTMGTVWRCHDTVLGRLVAVKELATGSAEHAALAEARIAARLQHPNIAPIYELGKTPSGGHWLVMREVLGRDLSALLDAAARRPDPSDLRRLVGVLHAICSALAYAHGQGVVHLDIKPSNIRVGDYGEAVLLDWGVAGDIGQPATGAGTPGFIAPEHVVGAPLDPRMDVYALGRLLHETLRGRSSPELEPLWRLARRALAHDPSERPADAGEMAQAIGRWLDGADDRAAARALIDEAEAMRPGMEALRARARRLEAAAAAALDALPLHAPSSQKTAAWDQEDAAKALRREADAKALEYEGRLDEARRRADDVLEARWRQADLYKARVIDAELDRDTGRAEAYVARLEALDTDGRHTEFLAGQGTLTLVSDPPGAEVWCEPYTERHRRLEPGSKRLLGRTPLIDVPLDRGSHQLRLVLEGHHDVIYPVLMPRGGRWTGIPPGADAPLPIVLPARGSLSSGECYVPAGWFWSGGDPLATDSLPRRPFWVDGFVMLRDPLTNRELMSDLDSLWAQGERERARRIAPFIENGGVPYFRIVERADGIRVEPTDAAMPVADWPVVQISWYAAREWARWRSECTGHAWRMPHDLEWEKAARGTDGRRLPWGDQLEPTWANIIDSRPGQPRPCAVHVFETDVSPYGVRGLTGNVRDWCINPYRHRGLPPQISRLVVDPDAPPGEHQLCRGGAWASKGALCHPAARVAGRPSLNASQLGVRLVRPLLPR